MEINIREDVKKIIERVVGHQYSYITVDDAVDILTELSWEIEHLEEELEDLKQNIEDNYRPVPASEQVGISDRDFL